MNCVPTLVETMVNEGITLGKYEIASIVVTALTASFALATFGLYNIARFLKVVKQINTKEETQG